MLLLVCLCDTAGKSTSYWHDCATKMMRRRILACSFVVLVCVGDSHPGSHVSSVSRSRSRSSSNNYRGGGGSNTLGTHRILERNGRVCCCCLCCLLSSWHHYGCWSRENAAARAVTRVCSPPPPINIIARLFFFFVVVFDAVALGFFALLWYSYSIIVADLFNYYYAVTDTGVAAIAVDVAIAVAVQINILYKCTTLSILNLIALITHHYSVFGRFNTARREDG